MKIKAKHVFFVGAFIVLTLIGYIIMPRNEVVIDLKSSSLVSGNTEIIETIFVHIEGAVNSPGIKEVPVGTRVFEIIQISDGETEDADLSKINLASILNDEQKIYVPFKASVLESSLSNTSLENITSSENYQGLVNINAASSEELQNLEGIGPSMAKKILDYREENGYFSSIEEIKNVSGIGEAKYNKIKDSITI